MSTAIIERIAILLEGQATSYNQMMDGATKKLDKFLYQARNVGSYLSAYVTVPIQQFATSAMQSYGAFDDAMTNSLSIMDNVSAEQRKAMEEVAFTLSEKTSTSATELAKGYYYLASSGMSATAATKALDVANQFALAGAVSLDNGTEMLVDSLSALGLKSEDATINLKNLTRVADGIAFVAKASSTSVEQLGRALGTKAAVAMKQAHKEMEEGIAVLGVYADKNIKGALAGERFNVLMRELTKSSIKHSDEWKSRGISVYDKTTGRMKHLADVVEILDGELAGLTDQQQEATLKLMGFESEAMDAIKPLLGMSDAIRSYEQRTKDAGGTVKEVADKQMTSFNKQAAIMANQMENIKTEIAKGLAPGMLRMNDIIRKLLGQWRTLSETQKTYIVRIVSVAAATGPAILLFARLIDVTVATRASFALLHTATVAWAVSAQAAVASTLSLSNAIMVVNRVAWFASVSFGALWAAITGPVGLVIAAIALVGAAIYGVAYMILGPKGMNDAWETAKATVLGWYNYVSGWLANFSVNMGLLITWISENWFALFRDVGAATVAFVSNMASNYLVLVQTQLKLISAFLGWLTIAVPAAYKRIFSYETLEIILSSLITAMEYMNTFTQGIQDLFKAGLQGVHTIFADTFTAIGELTVKFASIIGEAISKALKGELPNPIQMMAEFSLAAVNQAAILADKVGTEVEKAAKVVTDALAAEATILSDAFDQGASDMNFMNTASSIVKDGLKDMKGPLDGFKSTVADLPAFVIGEQEKALNAVVEAADEGNARLEDGANKAAKTVNTVATAAEAAAAGVDGVLMGSLSASLKIDEFLSKAAKKNGATVAGVPGANVGGGVVAANKGVTGVQASPTEVEHKSKVERYLSEISANTKKTFSTANLAGA